MVYLCDGVPQRLPFLAVVAQAVVIMPVVRGAAVFTNRDCRLDTLLGCDSGPTRF
jgi:hypothetical protein